MSRSETEAVVARGLIDPDLFRRACGRFATGIAVATVTGKDGQPYGLTINSFTSVSCCPPLILICIDYRCSLLPHFRGSSWFGISVLNDTQQEVSIRFALREADRFTDLGWQYGISGVPLVDGCLAQMECCVSQVIEAGDHAIFIAEVIKANWFEGEPLIYFGSDYRSLADR